MPDFKVTRSFSGNIRGSKVELSAKDGKVLLEAGYVEEVGGSQPKKRAAKKAAKTTAPESTPEVTAES